MFSAHANVAGSSSSTSCFSANAGHELRSPLSGIIGMLELLLDTALNDSQQTLAATAYRSAWHLLTLIDEMLDLPLLERDTLPLEPACVDLRAVLESAVMEQIDLSLQQDAELRTHWVVRPVKVQCDPLRLHQLIASIIRAAHRQHPRGVIDVAFSVTVGEGNACQLEMALNGRSRRLQPETESLSGRFAAMLARHMRASIEAGCDSADDQIIVRLPLKIAPEAPHKLRLLLVDAADGAPAALLQALRLGGMRVCRCATAAAAVNALREAAAAADPYQAAIIDPHLHGRDIELLVRAARRDPACRNTRLVLRTAMAAPGPRRLIEAHFSAIIDTSGTPQDILDALRHICADGDAGAPSPARPLDGYHVLVVDDHAVDRQVAARMLAKLGCMVEVACDGGDALAMHRSHPCDLILMDCRMPDGDGIRATTQIREIEHGRRPTPLIGCAAGLTSDERAACLEAGMDDFIAKPLQLHALRRLLEKWLPTRAACAWKKQDALDEIRETFGENFAELTALFIADSPQRISTMRAATAMRDTTQLATVAHAFSGSTASIGALALSALSRKLEHDARSGRLAQADATLVAIEQEYARIDARIGAMLTADDA